MSALDELPPPSSDSEAEVPQVVDGGVAGRVVPDEDAVAALFGDFSDHGDDTGPSIAHFDDEEIAGSCRLRVALDALNELPPL